MHGTIDETGLTGRVVGRRVDLVAEELLEIVPADARPPALRIAGTAMRDLTLGCPDTDDPAGALYWIHLAPNPSLAYTRVVPRGSSINGCARRRLKRRSVASCAVADAWYQGRPRNDAIEIEGQMDSWPAKDRRLSTNSRTIAGGVHLEHLSPHNVQGVFQRQIHAEGRPVRCWWSIGLVCRRSHWDRASYRRRAGSGEVRRPLPLLDDLYPKVFAALVRY